jgi:hypothetical protein
MDDIKPEFPVIAGVDAPRGILPDVLDQATADLISDYIRYERERCLFYISRERALVRALPFSREVSDEIDKRFRWVLALVRAKSDGILPEWAGDESELVNENAN